MVPMTCKENSYTWTWSFSSDSLVVVLLLLLLLLCLSPLSQYSMLPSSAPDAGKDWRQKENGAAEDEMVGWHHQFKGHELEQTPGVGGGQRSLVCCSPWGPKESDTTGWLNDNNMKTFSVGVGSMDLIYKERKSLNQGYDCGFTLWKWFY